MEEGALPSPATNFRYNFMWKCKHCSNEFDYTRTTEKANHSRHCKSNPDRLDTYKKVKESSNKRITDSLGEIKPFDVVCDCCGATVSVKEREFKFPSKTKYFCSRSCANSRIVTPEHKEKTSRSLMEYNLSIGKNVKPKIPIEKVCLNCDSIFETISIKKSFCNNKCSAQHRNKPKRATRDAFSNYRSDCAFRFNLSDFPAEFDFILIEQYGWYKAANRGNNLNGVSRDHMISVKYGFSNNIDPKIIAHPANCRLVRQSENSSKHDKCSIALDELLERIKIWDDKYKIN